MFTRPLPCLVRHLINLVYVFIFSSWRPSPECDSVTTSEIAYPIPKPNSVIYHWNPWFPDRGIEPTMYISSRLTLLLTSKLLAPRTMLLIWSYAPQCIYLEVHSLTDQVTKGTCGSPRNPYVKGTPAIPSNKPLDPFGLFICRSVKESLMVFFGCK